MYSACVFFLYLSFVSSCSRVIFRSSSQKMIPSIPSKKIHTTNKHSNTHTPFLLLQISVLFYLRANEKRKFFSLSNCRVLGFCFYVFFSTQRTLFYTMYSLFSIQFLSLINYQCLLLLFPLHHHHHLFHLFLFHSIDSHFAVIPYVFCECVCVWVFFLSLRISFVFYSTISLKSLPRRLV